MTDELVLKEAQRNAAFQSTTKREKFAARFMAASIASGTAALTDRERAEIAVERAD